MAGWRLGAWLWITCAPGRTVAAQPMGRPKRRRWMEAFPHDDTRGSFLIGTPEPLVPGHLGGHLGGHGEARGGAAPINATQMFKVNTSSHGTLKD